MERLGGGASCTRNSEQLSKRNTSGFGVVLNCHSPKWTGKDSEFFLFFLDFIFFKKKRSDCPHLRGRGEMQLKDTWIFEGFSKPDGGTGHARRRNTRGNKMPDFWVTLTLWLKHWPIHVKKIMNCFCCRERRRERERKRERKRERERDERETRERRERDDIQEKTYTQTYSHALGWSCRKKWPS